MDKVEMEALLLQSYSPEVKMFNTLVYIYLSR